MQGSKAGSGGLTLHYGADNPARACPQPCTGVPPTLHPGAPDLQDLPDLHELTGDEEKTGSEEEATPPFKVYAAIAKVALESAILERDNRPSNIAEHFKRLCAAQSVPYDARITQKATDAAIVSREKAKRAFHVEYRSLRMRMGKQENQ